MITVQAAHRLLALGDLQVEARAPRLNLSRLCPVGTPRPPAVLNSQTLVSLYG